MSAETQNGLMMGIICWKRLLPQAAVRKQPIFKRKVTLINSTVIWVCYSWVWIQWSTQLLCSLLQQEGVWTTSWEQVTVTPVALKRKGCLTPAKSQQEVCPNCCETEWDLELLKSRVYHSFSKMEIKVIVIGQCHQINVSCFENKHLGFPLYLLHFPFMQQQEAVILWQCSARLTLPLNYIFIKTKLESGQES